MIDLWSAYHKVTIKTSDKAYTAFETYQFCRLPFSIMISMIIFQMIIDKIILKGKLKGIFTYKVCIHGQPNHDRNLKQFMTAIGKYNLTLIYDKCFLGKMLFNHSDMLLVKVTQSQIQNDYNCFLVCQSCVIYPLFNKHWWCLHFMHTGCLHSLKKYIH